MSQQWGPSGGEEGRERDRGGGGEGEMIYTLICTYMQILRQHTHTPSSPSPSVI